VTPILTLQRLRPKLTLEQVRGQLGGLGFAQDKQQTLVGQLSGGERARLMLALATLDKPNLLILDEPTNHLDIDARNELLTALNDFDGAVILVSHDRRLIEATADRLLLVSDGHVTPFEGDLDDYRRFLLSGDNAPTRRVETAAVPDIKTSKEDTRRNAAEKRHNLKPLKDKVTAAESQIATLNAELAKLDKALSDPLLFTKDPAKEEWKSEVVDESFHALHNFTVMNFDEDPAEEIITASLEGIFLLDRSEGGIWKRTLIGEGNDDPETPPGAGEIKIGRFKSGKRYLATVEPWHGHQIVVYVQPSEPGTLWTRRVLDAKVKQGHALGCADFDGDGDDELVAGWREASEAGLRPGVAMYDPQDEAWGSGRKMVVDDGGMATEDLVIADLNQDGFPDVVASGRATHNIKIYWHPGK